MNIEHESRRQGGIAVRHIGLSLSIAVLLVSIAMWVLT